MKGEIPLSQLDELLLWFDEGRATGGIDEAYRRFNDVWMKHPEDLPQDPFSTEYAARYFEIYHRVSARSSYDPAVNERAEFDVVSGALRPFPFQGGSTKLAGEHFGYIARLLDMMDVPAGGDILEMGVGWGNTTLALAMLDFKVTALDIEERYLEVVRIRANLHQTANIQCVHDDFLWVERTDKKFDAVVFFESFHHCREFERLLRGLDRVLKPAGKLYFAAEPINRQFQNPWCVRLDGQSLFVARKNGWMELGFRSDFFDTLLRRTGWLGFESDHPHFWKAQRRSDPLVIPAIDVRIGSHAGTREGGMMRIDVPGGREIQAYAVFGPGIQLGPGRYRAQIDLIMSDEPCSSIADAHLDVCCAKGNTILAAADGVTSIEFDAPEGAVDVETRLLVRGGFRASMTRMTFQAIDRREEMARPTQAQTAVMNTGLTLAELLSREGESFVENVYLTLLKRPVDPTGRDYYLGRLRDGISKIQILSEVSRSAEALSNSVVVPGLRDAIRRNKLAKLPLVGRTLDFFLSRGRRSP